MERNPLEVDPETMRQLGYRTVDLLVDRLAGLRDQPVLRRGTPAELARRLDGPPPEGPQSFERILEQLGADVLPFLSLNDHPGFFAYVPGCGTWPGVLGDLVAGACNIEASSWVQASGPSQLELVVLGWFKQWIGYPDEAAGVLVSGGSAANLTALACAREALLGAMSGEVVAYLSDQAHSSMARAARVLGFRPNQVRVLPVDDDYRMRPEALAAAMAADLRAGRRPLFVAASAGSTSTGAVDPLPELAALCRQRGVWFHVDAAYGGFAALTGRGLKDTEAASHEVNFSDLSVQLSRASRALKALDVVALLRGGRVPGGDRPRHRPGAPGAGPHRGQRPARAAVAGQAGRGLLPPAPPGDGRGRPGAAEPGPGRGAGGQRPGPGLLDPAARPVRAADVRAQPHQPGRGRGAGARLVRAGARDGGGGRAHGAGARLRPRPAGHPELARPLAGGRVGRRRPAPAAAVPAAQRRPAGAGGQPGRERTVAEGEVVVERWDATREFYAVLEGTAAVRAAERHLDDIGPGDYFGELAALDRGASFGYARLATVTATSPMRLLVLANADLAALMDEIPGLAAEMTRTARDRLPGL